VFIETQAKAGLRTVIFPSLLSIIIRLTDLTADREAIFGKAELFDIHPFKRFFSLTTVSVPIEDSHDNKEKKLLPVFGGLIYRQEHDLGIYAIIYCNYKL